MKWLQKGTTLHLTLDQIYDINAKTLCGLKSEGDVLKLGYSDIQKVRGSHMFGARMVKRGSCKKCVTKMRSEMRRLYWYSTEQRREMVNEMLEPVQTPRPLPKKEGMGGVNRQMANIRERLRRRSLDWKRTGKLFTIKNSWEDSEFRRWDEAAHQAFLAGVNWTVKEVFDEFKLEKYDRFKEGVLSEIHEMVTGETMNTEESTRNEDV